MPGSVPNPEKGKNPNGGRPSFADVLGNSAAVESSAGFGNSRSTGPVSNRGPASAPPDTAARQYERASEVQNSSAAASSAAEAEQGKTRVPESKQASNRGESSKASADATKVSKDDGASTPAIGPLSAAEVEEIAERARTLALSGDAGDQSVEASSQGGPTSSKGGRKDQDNHIQGYGNNGAQPPYTTGGAPGHGYGGQGAGMPGGMTPLQMQQMQQMYYAQQQQNMANPGVPAPYAYAQYGYQGEMMGASDMSPGQ